MVGIYQNRETLHFCFEGRDGAFRYLEKAFNPEISRSEQLPGLVAEAQKELGFKSSDDFRVLADYPLSYSVAQSVPFPAQQLGQVLENYLEEELPDEIEDYLFDYKVLKSDEKCSSVLGFWIERQFLQDWSRLSDEQSFNSLDIQPAEMALLPSYEEPGLVMRKDHAGSIRYACLVQKGTIPSLALGKIPGANPNPENILRVLRFTGTNWKDVPVLNINSSLKEMGEFLSSKLCIPKLELEEMDEEKYFFCRWAAGARKYLEPRQMFNFRRGPYSQRGLYEKILVPVILISLALIFLIEAHAWRSYQTLRREQEYGKSLQKKKKDLWAKLFKDKAPEDKMMLNIMRSRFEQMTGSDVATDEPDVSTLQTLGRLFKYVKPATDKTLISNISIGAGARAILVQGVAPSYDDAAVLEKGFDNQNDFQKPNLNIEKGAGAEEVYKFRLSTSMIIPETVKGKK